jgi:hypothetical protein
MKAAEGTAANKAGVAAAGKVQDHLGEKQEEKPGVEKDRCKKLVARQSIKVSYKFTFNL